MAILIGMVLGYYIALNLVPIMSASIGFSDPIVIVMLNATTISGSLFFGVFIVLANKSPKNGMKEFHQSMGGHSVMTLVLFTTFMILTIFISLILITIPDYETLTNSMVSIFFTYMIIGFLAVYFCAIILAKSFRKTSNYYSKLFQPTLYLIINFTWVFLVAVQIMYWRN